MNRTNDINLPIFQKLTPINNVDLTVYKNALDFIFRNKDIKNIAISGPYSSGKSSIIETYKNYCKNKRFLHISLAHFTEMETNKGSRGSDVNETILEGKILNQLLHQIDASRIPQTDFKIKRTIPRRRIIFFTLLFVCSMLFIQYILNFEKWKTFVDSISIEWLKNILYKTTTSQSLIIAGSFIVLSIIIFIYSAINAQINKTIIKRLSFQGNNLELFDDKTESYFDKYLNEVLYIFVNSKADVIVFEDMDRYNANQIFVKLREINTLVNNKLEKQKRIIRFLYLLKDDIFTNKDKTKFFDFILPIIPVIDGSNSYDQFIKHFEDGGILSRFDKYFLQELSLYIDDMRILKNIYNEYIIYFNKIESIKPDENKLLAMMVYKNLFPRDFTELQLSKGYVYSLFSKKSTIIKNEIEKINNEITEIDKKIDVFMNEKLKDLEELETIYIKFPNYQYININGTNREDLKTNIDTLKAMKENKGNIKLYINNAWLTFDIQKTIDSLDNNTDYINRKKQINEKLTKKLDALKIKRTHLNNLIDKINNKNIKDILNKDNVEILFAENDILKEFSEIKNNDYFQLIRYLIWNGYIDETYPDYMTYFYANSITREDKLFLRSITNKKPLDYNYKLKNIEIVLSRIKLSYFEQEEILNFDLLSYLIKNRNKYENYIKNIFNQLIEGKNVIFISKYLETEKNIIDIQKCIADFWPNFLELNLKSSSIDKKQQIKFVMSLMNELEIEYINKYNRNNILTNYISNSSSFLSQQNINIELLNHKLISLSVKFINFEREMINMDFFIAVYKNELYQLNFNTISFILDIIYDIRERDNIFHKNYTSILSKPDEPLYSYIHVNIDNYVEMYLNNCKEAIIDEETAVIMLLNNKNISENKKIKYISFLKSIIQDINSIDNKMFWDLLIKNKCIKNYETNIFSYYFEDEKGLNQILIDFLNAYIGEIEIIKENIDNKYGENATSKFINDIVECDELSNEIYEKIVLSSQLTDDEFDKELISDDKILILIDIGTILMTEDNLIFMRKEYPDHVLTFIVRNIKKYIELLDEDNMIQDELINLLDKEIDDNDKKLLINKSQNKISIKDKNYSENVKLHILNNNLYLDDISYLLEIFDNETEKIKNSIINILAMNIEMILTDKYNISYKIFIHILKYKKIENIKKLDLFAKYINDLNNNQIKECLELMEASDYLSLFENKQPKIIVNKTNEAILETMEIKQIIKKYKVDKKDSKYYRVYGKMNNQRKQTLL